MESHTHDAVIRLNPSRCGEGAKDLSVVFYYLLSLGAAVSVCNGKEPQFHSSCMVHPNKDVEYADHREND